MTNSEFIEQIASYVKKYAGDYGIMVHSPIIAQAILESGWGRSTLASEYNNYFGLKCGGAWNGKSVNMATQEEYEVGVMTDIRDNFRVFDSMAEGVAGYYDFISTKRYANLKLAQTAQEYAERLKADGYATSSTYVNTLVNTVKKYNLTKYDTGAIEYFPKYQDSLVNALNAVGADSSYNYRKRIAVKNGISNYSGTADQNTKLLSLLKPALP